MSVRTLNALMQGMQASQDRLTKIRAARDQKRQADEKFEMDKKIKQLQIEKLEKFGGLDTAAIELEKQKIDLQSDLYDAQSNVKDLMISGAETRETKAQGAIGNTIKKTIASSMPGVDRRYVPGEGFRSYKTPQANSVQRQKKEDTSVTRLMGILDKKQDMDAQGNIYEISRDQAEMKATKTLGYNWQTKYPEVNDLINKKYLPSGVERLKTADQFGFRIGEEKQVSGKGRYQYVGENKWKKIEIK